ncbi:unnamed protein product [Auanema sp. JU1783]|nr:unnamed protein product [Auanema sp. JU1783]
MMSRDMGEGVFNSRKQALSLDLRPTQLHSSMTIKKEDVRDREAQAQYTQGFLDALRSVHNLNNFDFDSKNVLYSPSDTNMLSEILTPGPQLPPTTAGELQAILSALATTPSVPQAQNFQASFPGTTTQFSNTFNVLPGTSMTALTASLSPTTTTSSVNTPKISSENLEARLLASVSNLESDRIDTNIDIRGDPSEDSTDNASERSRSSSVALSHGKDYKEMSIDDQEQKKLERKRARNRAAASKCRQKKMDKIAELETQVSSEKQRGHNLDVEIQQLRETLAQLEHLLDSQRIRRPAI